MTDIELLEDDFLAGKVARLKNRVCPFCGQTGLLFTMSKSLVDASITPGARYRAGINIYCRAECNAMISYLDGFCPAWAEAIVDWEEFSDSLLDGADES